MIQESRRSRAAAPRQERSKNIITRQECGPRLSSIACTRGRGHQTSVQQEHHRGHQTRASGPRSSPIACTPGRGHQTRAAAVRGDETRVLCSKNIIATIRQGLVSGPPPSIHETRAAAVRGDETRVLCSKNIIVALIIRQKRAADYRRSPSIVCRVARAALTRPCASWD